MGTWKQIFEHMEGRWKTIISCLMLMVLFAGCDKLKGITTIYGTVTAPGVGPVDSVTIYVDASQGSVKTRFLTEVVTDEEGKYEVTVDAPRHYDFIECGVRYGKDGKIANVYRIAEALQAGKKVGTCSVVAGWKANFDFKLYK